MNDDMDRPEIDQCVDSAAFRRWYWLKSELVAFAREHGLRVSGGKDALADRIAHYLDTGDRERSVEARRPRPSSTFNWARATLTLDTVITDSFTNGPNLRAFMKRHAGASFRSSIEFMQWARDNVGKTLADAVAEWRRIEARRKAGHKAPIPAHNQFNQYVRDYFADNPDGSMAAARRLWAVKRRRSGDNRYRRSDLEVLLKSNGGVTNSAMD